MRNDGPLLVAVDAGTTGARATAVTLDGRVLEEARRSYRTETPHPGWAEQDPRDWREMSLAALFDLIAALGDGNRIAAIGLTGQCPTIAALSADGEPLGPGLMYRDNRASVEALQMRDDIGIERMHALTGHVAEAFHVGPKLLWLRRHQPEIFAAAHRFLQPRDVVLRALTGASMTDETHANSTVLFDLKARAWAEDLLTTFGLEAARFPDVGAPCTQAARVSQAVAERTGVPAGCPVVLGAADSQCAAFGSGVNEPGPISEMAGASSCLNSIVHEPLTDLRVTHYSHVLPDRYCTEVGVNTTGAAVQWAVTQLGYSDYASLESAAGNVHDALRAGAVDDPFTFAPLFLPYLGDGERDDVTLRAAFVGLADRHGRDELAYAVLEGIAFSVAEELGILVNAGARFDELRVGGGGARLRTLGAIKADTLGVPVLHLEADTAPVGVALLAARASGYAREVDEAIAAGVERAQRFEPDPATAEQLHRRREWFGQVRASAAVRLGAPGTEGSRS
jgi:xylulokinase